MTLLAPAESVNTRVVITITATSYDKPIWNLRAYLNTLLRAMWLG